MEPIRFSNVVPVVAYIAAMAGVIVALLAAFIAIGVGAGFIGRK
jgi:hypothetical protein